MDFGIDTNLDKKSGITEWAKELSFQDGLEINRAR